MSVNAYLWIKDVKGESKSEYQSLSSHKGEWVDILDVNFSLHNRSGSAYGGGSGVGKADFGDISFVKRFDTSSPTLMTFCATGKHIDKVEVKLFKTGGDGKDATEFLTVELEGCYITSLVPSGLTSGDGMESLGLSFTKFDLTYAEQDKEGKRNKKGQFVFDQKTLISSGK
jgi:type VI secretion system secreted protein Hcp